MNPKALSHLYEIQVEANRILTRSAGVTLEDYLQDDDLRDIVENRFKVIGEYGFAPKVYSESKVGTAPVFPDFHPTNHHPGKTIPTLADSTGRLRHAILTMNGWYFSIRLLLHWWLGPAFPATYFRTLYP